MKIVVITSPFGVLPPVAIGAVEKLFYLLAGEWVKMGHHVTFVCCGGGDDPRMDYVRLKKYSRTGSTKKDLIWDFLYSVKALWNCPRTDVLLCNTFWTPALAPLFRWKYKKLVYGVHRYPKRQFWLYAGVHSFVCVSSAVAKELMSQLRTTRRITVVVNPIDTRIFCGRSDNEVKLGRIIFAGRIHPSKGLEALAKAVSELNKEGVCAELVLVGASDVAHGGGGDDFVFQLQDMAAPCVVKVLGAIVNPSELAAIERTADVFVYPSEDARGEACPIGPMEAMALGVPTIVSGLACYDDYIQDGINALKFQTSDVADLRNKLKLLLTDSFLRKRLSRESEAVGRTYSSEAVAWKYIRLFEKL